MIKKTKEQRYAELVKNISIAKKEATKANQKIEPCINKLDSFLNKNGYPAFISAFKKIQKKFPTIVTLHYHINKESGSHKYLEVDVLDEPYSLKRLNSINDQINLYYDLYRENTSITDAGNDVMFSRKSLQIKTMSVFFVD